MYILTHSHVHTYIHTCIAYNIHTYTHTYIHTKIYTHIHTEDLPLICDVSESIIAQSAQIFEKYPEEEAAKV